jgi:hypothetical protein
MSTATAKPITHTPDPWQQHDEQYCPEEIWGALDGPLEDGQVHGELVCTVNMDHPRAEANIRLIKAAPESNSCNVEALWWLEHPALHDAFRADVELYARLNRSILAHRAAIAKAS